MKSSIHVASPPAKPLMVYDGDCNFCTLWIRRWECLTAGRVDYIPSQDARIAAQFPEIPRERFEAAVQLILPDGSVYSAAEAVFRSLAFHPHEQWLLELYEHSPVFARTTELAYRFIAHHRVLFSRLTRLLWGRQLEPATHRFVRWTFLRCLGIIYLIAFASLGTQIIGLVGRDGIVPAQLTMDAARLAAPAGGIHRFHLLPTLCWLGAGDGFLKFQCAAGMVLSVLLALGIAPAPCLFLLWLIYLSLSCVSDVFLGFQWDNLLLEAGFLAIFFAPLQLFPRHPMRESPPSRIVLWLFRWLVFRLMFESGCVKLASGDPSWRNLTALTFHYETQPLPTWIGWYAHQLPLWVQKSDTGLMFGIELVLPFFIFAPRRLRQFACLAFIALQLFILLTGNYGFFNLLTIVLCLVLLDDAALQKCVPQKWGACPPFSPSGPQSCARWAWPIQATFPLLVVTLAISLVQLIGTFRVRLPGPQPVIALYRWLLPFRSINSYGLFANMTTSRPEIMVEGSNDRITWKTYTFKYKPGRLDRRPAFVEPHQPRLDWQMWFAALSDYEHNPWFINFCIQLLNGSPDVLKLLETNPFPRTPPRYIRAVIYEYRFTDRATRSRTGEWWKREYKGVYLPPISLRE